MILVRKPGSQRADTFSGTFKEFHVTSDTDKRSADVAGAVPLARAASCGPQGPKVENGIMKILGFLVISKFPSKQAS